MKNIEVHKLLTMEVFEDPTVKIYIDASQKKVYFSQNGPIKPFKDLPENIMEDLSNKLLSDANSLRKLKDLPRHIMLERFAFYHFQTLKNDF